MDPYNAPETVPDTFAAAQPCPRALAIIEQAERSLRSDLHEAITNPITASAVEYLRAIIDQVQYDNQTETLAFYCCGACLA